jgi:hypothetical protein
MFSGFFVHQIEGVSALIRGIPNSVPEQVEEYITVAGENRAKCFSIALVRS